MANLDITATIFTEHGSRSFKNTIAQKKSSVNNYSNADLLREKEHLEFKRSRMIEKLNNLEISPANETTYKIYLDDITDIINKIDARLASGEGRARGKSSRSKSRRSKSRRGRSKSRRRRN